MDLAAPPSFAEVEDRLIQSLYAEGRVEDPLDLFANESVILTGPTSSALGIKRDEYIYAVSKQSAFSVEGRNAEQRFALELLLEPRVPIVSLGGLAGTGKSVLALAAGMDAVLEQHRYKRVVVFRPLYAVGDQSLGYLPGDFDEKMYPWAQATWDALDAFCGPLVQDEIVAENLLEVLPLTHLRGRTLSDSYIIIDEAQNLSRSTIVTALTRVGENSKVVLTHDINQRDNASVGKADGIMSIIERLMGQPLFGHVNLHKVERSAVAKMVSELFQDL